VSISSSIDCGLTLHVLKTLHAMTTLKMRFLDYHFFFVVLSFFQCNAIAYALHLRGGGGGVKGYYFLSMYKGVRIFILLLFLYFKSDVLYIVAFGPQIIQVAICLTVWSLVCLNTPSRKP
jgi:uncharacterized membrane protein